MRGLVYSKIKTNTFQGPTTVGVFMVVMPLVTFLLLILFFIVGIPGYYLLLWLFVMWLGTLIRPPFHVMWQLLKMNGTDKSTLKKAILDLREEIEQMTKD